MNAVRAEALRREEVRAAARAWRAAGAIDAAALARVEALYPTDRHRMATAWKVLVFVIVTIAANALFLAVAITMRDDESGTLWLVFAGALAGATEVLLHRSRVGENGSAAATSFWSAAYATAGVAILAGGRGFYHWETALTAACLAAAIFFAAAAWRWGFAAHGTLAAVAAFLLLARFPYGRLSWLLLGAAVAAVAPRFQDRHSLAPPLRRAAGGVFVVAAAALYAAVNRYSLDRRLVEALEKGSPSRPEAAPGLVLLSWIATAALPIALIVWGIRSRRPLVLDVGGALGALSLATLRFYVHLAPLWVVLAGAGAALVLAALGLHRWLRGAPEEERGGITVRPLFDPRRSGLETAAVVAAFAPAAGPAPGREPGGFTPGGGRYGGGGAEGSF